MLIHLYLAFWRPDLRDQLAKSGSPLVAMCDFVGNAESVITDTRNVTCPVCRENFLQALPTGDKSKRTWADYLASLEAAPRVTMAQRAAEADAAWSTKPIPETLATAKPGDVWATTPAPAPTDGWSTVNPSPGPQADAWAATPKPPVQPGGPATGSKADPYLAGIQKRWPGDGWSTEK